MDTKNKSRIFMSHGSHGNEGKDAGWKPAPQLKLSIFEYHKHEHETGYRKALDLMG